MVLERVDAAKRRHWCWLRDAANSSEREWSGANGDGRIIEAETFGETDFLRSREPAAYLAPAKVRGDVGGEREVTAQGRGQPRY